VGTALKPLAVDLEELRKTIGSKDQDLLKRLTKKFRRRFAEVDEVGDELEDDDCRGNPKADADLMDRAEDFYHKLNATAEARGISLLELLQQKLPKALQRESDELASQLGRQAARSNKRRTHKQDSSPRASAAEALRHLIMGEKQDRRVGFKYGCVVQCLCEHFGEMLEHERWDDLRRGSTWFQKLDRALVAAGVSPRVFSIRRQLQQRGSPIQIPNYSDFPSIGYLKKSEITRALKALRKADLADVDKSVRESVADIRGWLEWCVRSRRDLVCFYE
jgi:hypothetical protein